MATLSRLRLRLPILLHPHRHLSSSTILSPDSTPLTSLQKSRQALRLLKTETHPERILEICRAAELTPDSHLDRVSFSLAISSLTKSNNFHYIQTFLESLKLRPDLQTDRFMSHAIILYGQSGMVDHAIRTFKQTEELGIRPTTKTLNALLLSCILGKKYAEVNRIFLEFPKDYRINPNLDTYNTVIKAFCESGSSSSVYSILDQMKRKGCKPNATSFGTMLAGFYKEEKFEDVGKVLQLMEEYGEQPGVSTYNIRIQSLCKLKKSDEAKALFEGMVAKKIKPNSVTHYYLIYGYCKEGNLQEAKKLFDDMLKKGVRPCSECYFTLVYYLCQGGDFDTALRVCKDCLAKDWVPNFTTMKSLVNGLAGSSKVEEARELVGKMKEKFKKNADLWNEIEAALPQ